MQVEVGKAFRVNGKLRDIHGEALAGKYVSVQVGDGPDYSALTDDSGAFEFSGKVEAAGEFLVGAEFAGEAPVLPSKARARLVARHTVGLSLDMPTELDRGSKTTFTGRITSETLSPIGQLELSVEGAGGQQLAIVTTSEDGSFEVTVPGSEESVDALIAFKYDGNDFTMPISYLLSIPVAPAGFNWLLWVGVPSAVVAVIIAGVAGRTFRGVGLPAFLRRGRAAEAPPETSESLESEGPVPSAEIGAAPAHLEVGFVKPAEDLPDVWGVGETVTIEAGLADNEGQAIAGATIDVSIVDDTAVSRLVTDGTGACTLMWTAEELGEYVVSAQFDAHGERAVTSAPRSFRVVDFREEIVRLYNDFFDWAEKRAAAISEQSTPREVELILVGEGLHVDQRSLDELVSRFEEADYSEHPIARRHYEAMYRAWHAIVRD